MQQNDYNSFDALRSTFSSADKVGDLIVFNIGGNKYRLITSVHFNRGKVYTAVLDELCGIPKFDPGWVRVSAIENTQLT